MKSMKRSVVGWTLSGSKVDINTAAIDDLADLEGIGENRARSIVRYRDKNGLFRALDDVLKVSGIGSVALDNLRDQAVVS